MVSPRTMINAYDELYIFIAMLLSALVVIDYVTDDLSFSTVLPIPKGKILNYSDSANYRGIALSSIIGKIMTYMYWVVMRRFLLHLIYSLASEQHIQNQCVPWFWKKLLISLLYITNSNDVYCTLLYATKAFDRVENCKLIRLLSIKNVPAVTIRFL